MHEELVKALRFCAEKSNGWNCPACPGFDGLCSAGKEIRATAADALEAVSAQLAAKDAEIERLTKERDAAVTLVETVNNIAVGAIEDGPYQDGEEAKIFSGIETITRTPKKQGKEG